MHVYATRLLLYLIAHPSLRLLMEHLSPAAPPSPVTPLPAQPTLFASRGGGAAPPFSLEGVLKSCEHTGYREADQPEGLALALKRYQLQAPGGRRVGAALLKPPPPARIARYTPSHSPPHFLAQPLSRPPSRPSRGWSTWRTRPSCRAASTGSSGRSGRGRTEAGTTTRARWARCGCRRRPSPFGGRGVASRRYLGHTSATPRRWLRGLCRRRPSPWAACSATRWGAARRSRRFALWREDSRSKYGVTGSARHSRSSRSSWPPSRLRRPRSPPPPPPPPPRPPRRRRRRRRRRPLPRPSGARARRLAGRQRQGRRAAAMAAATPTARSPPTRL